MKLKIFKKSFYTKKKIIWGIIIILALSALGYFIFGKNKSNINIQTTIISNKNLQETVLTTGQVVSGTDLNLSFQGSGIIRQVLVKSGDKVYAGKVLATIDQTSARASLMTAEGSLKQAQANYDKLVNGATSQELQAYYDVVTSAKVNLNNTYNNSLSTLNSVYAAIYNASTVIYTLQNTYFSSRDPQGIRVQDSKNNIDAKLSSANLSISLAVDTNTTDLAISNLISDLNSVLNSLTVARSQCDDGIYYSRVTATDKATLDAQKTVINTSISNVSTLQNSISSYKIALQTATNNLDSKKSKARQEDIDLAKAQILSAEGQVALVLATINNLTLVAPSSGTITSVDIKVGEQAVSMKEVMILQNVSDLHAEANVSEANIASLKIGQLIEYTFDALGPNRIFSGQILTIDPASTVISGVVNYKITGFLDNIPEIKPGMTANMTVLVAKKDNVLAVPSSAVISKNNKQFVKVIDDLVTKTYHEVEVKTGMQADGGMVEILSGLSAGQTIVIYIKP